MMVNPDVDVYTKTQITVK